MKVLNMQDESIIGQIADSAYYAARIFKACDWYWGYGSTRRIPEESELRDTLTGLVEDVKAGGKVEASGFIVEVQKEGDDLVLSIALNLTDWG